MLKILHWLNNKHYDMKSYLTVDTKTATARKREFKKSNAVNPEKKMKTR